MKKGREREYPSWSLFQTSVTVAHCFFMMNGHDIYESAYIIIWKRPVYKMLPWHMIAYLCRSSRLTSEYDRGVLFSPVNDYQSNAALRIFFLLCHLRPVYELARGMADDSKADQSIASVGEIDTKDYRIQQMPFPCLVFMPLFAGGIQSKGKDSKKKKLLSSQIKNFLYLYQINSHYLH